MAAFADSTGLLPDYLKKVNPAIFGTILEQALEANERHVLGAHYTYERDIKKVVIPTIVMPWQQKIEATQTLDELYALLDELVNFRVLDPACGSGNFLFVAFKELKLIEQQIMSRIRERSTGSQETRRLHDFLLAYPLVSTKQFYGIDKKPFSVELAKVTLIIAKELAYFEFQETFDSKFSPLPLDNLDENIICADALLQDDALKVTIVILPIRYGILFRGHKIQLESGFVRSLKRPRLFVLPLSRR